MFKKTLSLTLCILIILSLAAFPVSATEGKTINVNPINILVGGEKFLPTDSNGNNVPVFEYNGTTYAPLRALAESYGLSVGYDNQQKLATVSGSASYKNFIPSKGNAQALNHSANVTVYPINIMVNGIVFKPVDSAGRAIEVFTYKGTTYAPLRALAEAYGLIVSYDHSQRLASVEFNVEAEVYADAEDMRLAILESKTEIIKSDVFIPGETYTGTAYYVSSSEGRDGNDGLSPNRPVKDIGYINATTLKPGDAVFFKRGDTWRLVDNLLLGQEGVTYSAYGEGEKPLITGSPENGADGSKWKLYYEDESGKKVWKFYRDINDVGGIVVNDGEDVLERAYGWWKGTYYTDIDLSLTNNAYFYDWVISENGVQDPKYSLNNLEFCCMIDYSGCDYPIRRHELYYTGGLYLRCDEGNPGEVYDSIEFMTQELSSPNAWMPLVYADTNCVFDNLNISYWSNCAISTGGDNESENFIMQNCEVAYGGNGIHEFISPEATTEFMLSGDGIYGLGRNGIVRNNYVHDVDGGGITFETGPVESSVDVEHFIVENNLVERCGGGIQLNDGNGAYNFDTISIRNNMVIDTGSGWTHNCFCTAGSIIIGSWGKVKAESITIANNTMMGSTMSLLYLNEAENVVLTENTYICKNHDFFAEINWNRIVGADNAKSALAAYGEQGSLFMNIA